MFLTEVRKQMMFKDELDNRLLYINSVIKEFLPESDNELYKKIIDAACYSVEAGGKRIRPMIMLETYRLCGGKDEEIVKPFMAALEYIHTYSLVHDDLPAMDNDDYRRGRLTTHKVFGEDFGILAGDALLNYAYEVMTSAVCAASPENMKNCAGAAAVIARKAGIFGMVGGQSLDVLLTDKPVNEKEMEFIFNLKTGALIEAAFMAGAILAGAGKEGVSQLEKAGNLVGVAFQIKDDIFDYYSPDEIGKPTGNDMHEGKLTLPALHVLNTLGDERMCQLALRIKSLDATDAEISLFIDYVKKNGGIEYAKQVMVDYRNKALELLPSTADTGIKDALTAYIDYVIEREK